METLTLNQLRDQLRRGLHPTDIGGSRLGNGAYRTAFAVGPFVVKETQPVVMDTKRSLQAYADAMKALGLRLAPTVKVGSWDIQLRYFPLPKNENLGWRRVGVDIHGGNVGRDRRGRFVAFDW